MMVTDVGVGEGVEITGDEPSNYYYVELTSHPLNHLCLVAYF